MANIKPEDSNNSIWQGYSLQAPTSSSSHPPIFEPNFTSPVHSIPYHGRQKSSYRSLDIPSIHTRPPPGDEGNGVMTASPPSLNTHHSYPSLKRGFQSSENLPYGENVHNFREDMPVDQKPTMNQDHRLLSFARQPEKHTIVNSQGRVQQIELAAQIHGMFFLSELATPSSDNALAQPELTCYRRNLFQISGNVTTPRGPISLISERGDRIPIVSMEVTISATESVDGHVVKLIVIPWKTPPANSPEVGPGTEHEPTPIPLEPLEDNHDGNGEFTVYPIAYRRLQFRIATANNGRRRELQQHFTLHLNVVGMLANGTKTNLCETSTAPIVVRGRSPRNFQARKEIPLVGSSSSRGQPPELHVSTTNMPIAIPSDGKGKPAKPQTLELPRSPFTFDSGNIQGSPSLTRQSTYPAWSASHTSDHTNIPSTPSYGNSSAVGLENYLQVNQTTTEIPHPSSHSPTATMSATQPPPIRQQYAYHPASAPVAGGPPIRFIDSNPRPAKSPRHAAPPELPSNAPYSDYGTRFAPAYSGPPEPMPPRNPDYFPNPVSLPTSWTTAAETAGVYGTSSQTSNGQQHYDFPGEPQYVKNENNTQSHYTWNAA
ncbi:Transcription factor [Lachnellula hyalina]|uniref:Transcription factor n=1 Tax=Lachnellula hyalina TaxID=1316788 RepID=A0A8H8TYF6_9HELO|nr:Transcription factor [Lachnellula hyalina]TVY27084.1 Transcription factor [Lachnellula hyalina]